EYVLTVIRENYPDLKIPFHSRNNHLNAGGVNRLGALAKKLSKDGARVQDIARAKIDLIVVSVLLDAGAGDSWKYIEPGSGKMYSRSEGLAVASYHMFEAGAFSSRPNSPLQADVDGLLALKPADLARHFQVGPNNPLIGVEGRVHLLNTLAEVMKKQSFIFRTGRIGDLYDFLTERHGPNLKATHVLDFVLRVWGEIWPSRLKLGNQSLGDVWSYPGLGAAGSIESFVPFHKLSQWLSYSLLVPILETGVQISGVDEMTGLPEYRNGGLLLDLGLIELRDPAELKQKHEPQSDLIVEWRALTVVLLDMIGESIRQKLKMNSEELPLAKVLEGGTWHAGRKIAKAMRPGGEPPLNIVSDGTVF
ncbi:MAG: DUF1688 family protein, partial [Pseudobdellovibrionaceae bacterium]